MKRQKRSPWRTIGSFLLVLFLVFYVGYQVYRGLFATVQTELVVSHSVYESIETEGIVFRTETIIPAKSSGYTYYTIENGTRVAKGGVIASVYKAQEHGRIQQQIEEIDQHIAELKAIQADGSSGRLTLDVLNEQMNTAICTLVQQADGAAFAELEGAKFDLLSIMSKKQLVTGVKVDFTKKIAEYEQQKKALQQKFKAAISQVKAPVAGYFADSTDGFENFVDVDDLQGVTVEQMQKYLTMDPPKKASTGGKIVSGYEWYMGCVVPDRYYNTLGEGKTLTLRMSFVTDEQIPVTVHSCKKDNKGNLAVVFRCDYMSEDLSTIRKEAVQIQLVQHTGLKVPKRAVIMDENQQAGVYVRSGNVMAFRKINQLYSGSADYVICQETKENGYLRLYDDVIVGGRDLYDGKIIG